MIRNICFVGACSAIMYRVTIANNVIVVVGSVVTKSVNQSNVIVDRNLTRVIGLWDKSAEKVANNVIHVGYLPGEKRKPVYYSAKRIVMRESVGKKIPLKQGLGG